MIRIICTECKNAYLRNNDGKLICPSCEATFREECENLLLGIQYYNEGNYGEADNCLMKYIVKNGADPLAVIYKALCDAKDFDEDTDSLEDAYKKIIDSFADVSDEDFPKLIAISNDLIQETEKALAESHVRLFADADAEKIKKEVAAILNIQDKATAFRANLSELVTQFNERSAKKISVKFSDCFYVEKEIAEEVGNIKFQKICDNIASHTVFTGILTNDIKNLEIYYRCIVMFFQKSHDKYEFLLSQAEKFNQLEELLEQGQYNTIKGTGAIADKLKSVSYEFLQESYKEHFDEQIFSQNETVVFIEPEVVSEPVTEETDEKIAEKSSEENGNTPETQEAAGNIDGENEPETFENEDTEIDSEVITQVNSVEESSAEEKQETETREISESVTEDSPEEERENDLADDVIEIEVQETSADEEKVETENISSASVDEEVEQNVVETEEEATAEDVSDETSEADESDGIVEIEAEPQYDVVECDIPVIDADADDNPEEAVQEDKADKKPKKKKSRKGLVLFILIIILAGVFAGCKFGPKLINDYKYNKAVTLAEEKKYDDAITVFTELGDYSDSKDKLTECEYNKAVLFEEAENFADAKALFEKLGNYADSQTRVQACAYSEAKVALEAKDFDTASKLFAELGDYGDSESMVTECSYQKALSLIENKEYENAIEILTAIKKYSDAKDKITEAKYMYVTDNFDKTNKTTVKYLNELTSAGYRNSAELRKELLGSSEVTSSDVKAFVNYSSTDLETSLTKLDNTKVIYFHTVVNDKSLYGQTLTLKYTTAFGYTQKQTVTLSESNNTAVMSYPSTQYTNYTVEFELLDSNGKTVAQQKISF
ncbi:MAG: hypothetical protein ACI4VW_04665 [Acutalibacteraceae bacterium]